MQVEQTIAYATPAPRDGPRVWAGAAIVFAGLALIGLGGCFLIGVLTMVSRLSFGFIAPAPPTISPGEKILIGVLSLLAGCCFAGAVVLLLSGLRGLFSVLKHR